MGSMSDIPVVTVPNMTCNFNIIPPEVREQVFRPILMDYFAEHQLTTTFTINTFVSKYLLRRENRNDQGFGKLTILHDSVEITDRVLAISPESSWIGWVVGTGWRGLSRRLTFNCYQLVWAAGAGRKLLICEKTESEKIESEQLNG